MAVSKKILIATGGTGGHLYPGIALARELKRKGSEVVFVVKTDDLGRDIIKEEGFEYREIPVIGLPRKPSFRLISFFVLLIKSYFKAKAILSEIKPVHVAGMGGYISFPVVFAAKKAGIKTLVHEQNYIPGLANKFLSKTADQVAVSFEESLKYFPKDKTVFTGNPVRRELFSRSSLDIHAKFGLEEDRFTVLVFGGSQGSKRINAVLQESLMFLSDVRENIQFIHIAGKDDVAAIRATYKHSGFVASVLGYLNTIGDAYTAADMIICRSGATTVAELKILNKPAILVPYPYATANHQAYNALPLVRTHQAVMMKENELRAEVVAENIKFRMKTFQKLSRPKPQLPEKYPQETIADLILNS